ncbi:MAG: adenine phosphoribosyltransferase [Candidatus Dormibacteraceae bacterium]
MCLDLRQYIATVPDFPVSGILYRDITPLLNQAAAFGQAIEEMVEPWRDQQIDLVAATEARGFLFAAPMAIQLKSGLVPVRKAGRLPRKTKSVEYTLEYRSDTLHIHQDAIQPNQRVLVVDDVLATGGTASAVAELISGLAGQVVGMQFLIEISELNGLRLLMDYDVKSVLQY